MKNITDKQMLKEIKDAIDEISFISKTDLNGNITYVNDLFCKLSGYTREELIGSPHNLIRHPDMSKKFYEGLWKNLKNKKMWKGIIKNKKKDGSSYYVKSIIKPILNKKGEIIEYIAIRTDVTELEEYKKILEDNLNASNNNLKYLKQYEKGILEFIAVMKTNLNNTIIYVNENFEKISGYSRNELLGKNCQTLRKNKHIENGDCKNIEKKLKNKEKISILFENICKNGNIYYLDTKIYPLINKNGEIEEFLHFMYDVTEIIDIHKELEKTQKDIIYKMGEIGETRSQETGNHVKRVAKYSKLLAELYGLSKQESQLLYNVSPMHDIGKVGIPDAILKKTGKLNKEEWEVMKTHSEIGFNILKNSERKILRSAAIVAHEHHEKWDGNGYPRGLKGKEIHIYGRITALADVFDALGSNRCYKKAWELDKIIEFFKEQKGKHFDPDLINIFFKNLDKFLKIRDEFKD